MSKIYDNLFLGSYQDARNQSFLNRNKVTHIVTVGAELKPLYPKNYKYLYIQAHDMPQYKLIVHFDNIADFIHNAIEEEKGVVFVHCFAGISRSSSSVIAYLMKHKSMSLIDAKNFVKSKRSIIWPNPGFLRQLSAYSQRLFSGENKGDNIMKGSTLTSSFMRVTATKSFEVKPKEFGSFLSIKSTTSTTNKGKEEVKKEVEEEKKVESDVKFDYMCRKCGHKLFNSASILHNTGRTFNAHCNAIYIEPVGWMGNTQTSRFSKILCPNTKCNDILGFKSLKGGKCGCNKEIGNMCGIYPLRVSYVKLKA